MAKKFIVLISFALILSVVFAACKTSSPGGDNTTGTVTQPVYTSETETETETTQPAPKYTPADNLLALTFDDGPGYKSSQKILDVLEQNNSVATFFVVGYELDEHPENTKRAAEIGCEIANHTKDHKNLTRCTDAEIQEQIKYVNDKVEAITGKRPVLLRAPGGNISGIESKVGMPLIQWSIDTNDWRKKDAAHKDRTAEQRQADINSVVDHVMTNAGPGQIVLMHEIYDFTADVCEILIPKLVAAGYKLVTVSEMFEAYGIELENGKSYRFASSAESAASNKTTLDAGQYIVNTVSGALNLRSEPNTGAAVLSEVPKGTALTVTESVEGWAKVTYAGQTGWVSATYLLKQS